MQTPVKIVNTATLQKFHVGQTVFCNKGPHKIEGVIVEIRDNCQWPIFVKHECCNGMDCYSWNEVSCSH